VLSGRGLCDELITRPEESYRVCCVVVCDLETSIMGVPYIYDISSLRVKVAANRIKWFHWGFRGHRSVISDCVKVNSLLTGFASAK